MKKRILIFTFLLFILSACALNKGDIHIKETEKETQIDMEENIQLPSEIEDLTEYVIKKVPDDLDYNDYMERVIFDMKSGDTLTGYINDNNILNTNPQLAYKLWHRSMNFYRDFADVLQAYPEYGDKKVTNGLDDFYQAIDKSDDMYEIHTSNVRNGIKYSEDEAEEFISEFSDATKTISDFIRLFGDTFG